MNVMLLALTGCSSGTATDSVYEKDEHEKSTQPQHWDGPSQEVVFTSDNAHCGKSEIATELKFPGFVNVKWPDGPAVYHSTEEKIKFDSTFEDTNYRLNNWSLWKKLDSTDEVYIGASIDGTEPEEVVVYKLGGCE